MSKHKRDKKQGGKRKKGKAPKAAVPAEAMTRSQVKCGNCKQYHDTAQEVLDCYKASGKIKSPEAGHTEADRKRHRETMKKTATETIAPVAPVEAPTYGRGGLSLPFPPGRYAIKRNGVILFYKVEQPEDGKWKGYVFVSVQASDDFHPIKDRQQAAKIIRKINRDPKKAMIRYGKELGVCGACGRTLTNDESRRLGIGPVCRTITRF